MKITLKLFASLADFLPAGSRSNIALLELAEAPSVGGLIESMHLPPKLVHLVLVNGNFIAPDARAQHRLNDGDVLAIWPPIAGG